VSPPPGAGALAETVPYHRSLGIRVEELAADRVRLRVPYKDDNSNPGRALHGGVYASAIDVAGVLAARSGGGEDAPREPRTLDLGVVYLAAAIGEDVVAEARVLRRGKEIVYADVEVQNDAGKLLAKGLVTHRAAPPGPVDRDRNDVPAPALPPNGEIPPLAGALTAVPFIAARGMAIAAMHGGRAVVDMPFRPDNADAAGAVHEGAVAALLDTAGAMAAWSVVGLDLRWKASTVGIHVSFHAPARGEDLAAHARVLRRVNESFQCAVAVHARATGRAIATGSVTYRIVVPG
jgi:uncharacterized protein (TIGR00369 family)